MMWIGVKTCVIVVLLIISLIIVSTGCYLMSVGQNIWLKIFGAVLFAIFGWIGGTSFGHLLLPKNIREPRYKNDNKPGHL